MKKKRKTDGEDRTEAYRDWRRYTFGDSRYVLDIDQVEFKFTRGGALVPVAIFELTRSDYPTPDPTNLQNAVLERIKGKAQGKLLTLVAGALGIDAYIVLFEKDLSRFYVYNLSRNMGWGTFTQEGFRDWVSRLHEEVPGG